MTYSSVTLSLREGACSHFDRIETPFAGALLLANGAVLRQVMESSPGGIVATLTLESEEEGRDALRRAVGEAAGVSCLSYPPMGMMAAVTGGSMPTSALNERETRRGESGAWPPFSWAPPEPLVRPAV